MNTNKITLNNKKKHFAGPNTNKREHRGALSENKRAATSVYISIKIGGLRSHGGYGVCDTVCESVTEGHI